MSCKRILHEYMCGSTTDEVMETSPKRTKKITPEMLSCDNSTCKLTANTHKDNMTDELSSPATLSYHKTSQYKIKRARRKLGIYRKLGICYHDIPRSQCKVCDPVGYKMSRIRSCVAGGLKRVGTVKSKKTIQYLGVTSFDCVIQCMQKKMDLYNTKNPDGVQMTFENIHIDHIKPAKAFADEINHYTNLQPLLPTVNMLKKACWSQEDELFWRENIQNQPDYTEIYMSVGVEPEAQKMPTPGGDKIKPKKCEAPQMSTPVREVDFIQWITGQTNSFASVFEERLTKIRDSAMELHSVKLGLNLVIQKFKDDEDHQAEKRVNDIFVQRCAFESNQNILLGMYTLEKLQDMVAYKHHSNCNIMLLLNELMGVFNIGLEVSLQLKPLDITLAQRSYDEDEKIAISDTAWNLYQKHCRMVRTRPITRRGLMGLIFSLSQKLFGKWSTRKITTCRRVPCKKNGIKKIKCYNYEGNDLMVRVHVGLADWSKRELHDFDIGIAAKYKLSECQQRDREAARQHSNEFRKKKSFKRQPECLNKLVLKRMAKRAVAQRNYTLMLSSTPDELESTLDSLDCIRNYLKTFD